jgi:hypothetical protein
MTDPVFRRELSAMSIATILTMLALLYLSPVRAAGLAFCTLNAADK